MRIEAVTEAKRGPRSHPGYPGYPAELTGRGGLAAGLATQARGSFDPGLVYLGWRFAPVADPGAPPAAPPPGEGEQVSAGWLAARRREYAQSSRSSRLTAATAALTAGAVAAGSLSGWIPADPALVAGLAAVAVAVASCARVARARRALGRQVRTEEQRVAAIRAALRDDRAARLQEHGRQQRSWQQRAAAFARRPHWHPVALPVSVPRVDVVGGTRAGWSALLTTMAAARLASGGDVTVLDLTGGGVAADLLMLARQRGISPLAWVVPADLPLLDLGTGFGPETLADVLARTVAAAVGPAPAQQHAATADAALLRRVLAALGDGATVRQLIAALRAVGQIGGPAGHLTSADLSPAQLAELATLAGHGSERLVIERAWALEAALQALAALPAAGVPQPASALQVIELDGSTPLASGVLASFLVVALTETLCRTQPAAAWQHTVVVLGAERLAAEVLDRLCDTADTAATGLVLGYRSIPPHVRDRLGRGDSAVAVMRLGNAADARLAADQIGTEYRFAVSQLTDSVGVSVSEAVTGSYTSSVGSTETGTDSRSVTQTTGQSRGRSRAGGSAAIAGRNGTASRDDSYSAAVSDSTSISAAISTGTSWGISTSRAVGLTGSAAVAAQRTREFLVEPSDLQHLPHSAVVLCYPQPAGGGRSVVLADANPAIMALPTATLLAGQPVAARMFS